MKKLLYLVLAIILAIILAIFVIDEKYHFEKSIVINAPAEKVYQHINSTKVFNAWNPWLKMDPNLTYEYLGTSGEVGDKYCWKSEKRDVGNGCQEIIALIPNQKQSSKMSFEGMGEAFADIILTPQGNQTKVTWTLDSEMKRPQNIYTLFMDSTMDKSYGEGLEELKKLSEKP